MAVNPYGPIAKIAPTQSNGATLKPLVAALAGTQVYLSGTLSVENKGTVAHTIQFVSDSGGRVIIEFQLPATASMTYPFIIEDRGDLFTDPGEGLSIKFTDGGGAVTDIVVSGTAVQR